MEVLQWFAGRKSQKAMAKLRTVGTGIAANARTTFRYDVVRNPPLGVAPILAVRWQRRLTIHDAGFYEDSFVKPLVMLG